MIIVDTDHFTVLRYADDLYLGIEEAFLH